jgi:hypothetical protein
VYRLIVIPAVYVFAASIFSSRDFLPDGGVYIATALVPTLFVNFDTKLFAILVR